MFLLKATNFLLQFTKGYDILLLLLNKLTDPSRPLEPGRDLLLPVRCSCSPSETSSPPHERPRRQRRRRLGCFSSSSPSRSTSTATPSASSLTAFASRQISAASSSTSSSSPGRRRVSIAIWWLTVWTVGFPTVLTVARTAGKPTVLTFTAVHGLSGPKFVSFSSQRKSFSPVRMQPGPLRFRISCAAKPETVEKVCEIVRKQLALPEDATVSAESKFASLGADSLDTVEIVMGLEEEFGISVEEESAQSINTVQDAADLIDKLVDTKSA